jgi:LysM repeat protein
MSRIRRAVAATSLATISLLGLSIATPVAAAPAAQTGQYLVKPGDFLAGIAAKVGVALPDLLSANNLTVKSVILPGQTLVVPGAANPAPAAAPTPAPTLTYTVKAGDYLFGIAGAYKVALADLLKANGLTVQSLIQPGKVLTLPANAVAPAPAANAPTDPAAPVSGGPAVSSLTYTVANGDFLAAIAGKYKVKLADLLAVNKLKATSLILPGLKLALPAGAVAPETASQPLIESTSGPAGVVVAYAYAQLGKPYRFFTDGPNTFDCSGLTKAAYAQIGMTLVHQSAAQAAYGTPVDIWGTDTIKPGDLIFMATHGDPNVITHVGIAVDATHWIHAPRPGDVVRLAPLPAKGLITAVRRLIPDATS